MAYFQNCFFFKATKRIKKGEELLYSYGNGYWKTKFEREAGKAKEDYCVKACFEFHSNDAIAKLNKRIAESTSEEEKESLEFHINLIKGITKAYDNQGDSLQDYLNRHILTTMLARYNEQTHNYAVDTTPSGVLRLRSLYHPLSFPARRVAHDAQPPRSP